jgi:predicted DNA-binding mobile mystery protein A
MLDRSAEQFAVISSPETGWIATMRRALGMSAEQVARRRGVTRNAVYQAERSEKEGSVSLKQMEKLAAAMGGTFVYTIVPNSPIEQLKYQHALDRAKRMADQKEEFASWSPAEQQDWVDDTAAQLIHDMPTDFWEDR